MMPLSKSLKESLALATATYQGQLAEDPEARTYLEKRGIDHELAADFRLGVVNDPLPGDGRYAGRLSIPFLGPADQVFGLRFRALHVETGPKYLGQQGVSTRLYNVRCLHLRDLQTLCITEGEIDAISVAAAGMAAVGVCGADNWKRHHPRLFAGFERVYVFGDGDEAGRKFSRRVAGSLMNSVEIPLPDGQDVNSILVAGGPEAVRELVGI